jgi:hypothetical protein
METLLQLLDLVILSIPIAWAAWTFTREEMFREVREFCSHRSHTCRTVFQRKFFYLFTCEYCFSHWIALLFQLVFRFRLVFDDWRGYIVGWIALIWMANLHMSLYQRLRVDIRKERAIADRAEQLALADH